MRRLGVNINHVATIRNDRGEFHTDTVSVAKFVRNCGDESLTLQLREDRRNIKNMDDKNISS